MVALEASLALPRGVWPLFPEGLGGCGALSLCLPLFQPRRSPQIQAPPHPLDLSGGPRPTIEWPAPYMLLPQGPGLRPLRPLIIGKESWLARWVKCGVH